jgi:lipopolysaccharide/colanic/teichoic acid biosynthesis glycosyltransferase
VAERTRIVANYRTETIARAYTQSRVKRSYDLVLATTLLLLSAPVLIPVLLLNTIFTGGHPIFLQSRVGKDQTDFWLIKMRTMRRPKNDEYWSHRTDANDGRVTFFGMILRRMYVDELPQLVNVILGQMSMIGPRPETLETTQEISKTHPRFVERMLVKPGITGTAQVYFRKPESDMDLWRRYYYDRAYITGSSLKTDLKLTAQTILLVLRSKGT